ncbi:MAG TPA: hypothetical protein ENJ08_11090 [Gammaproteobacteria bacterium]|nr:hypothetical protein [Gammaproteobacteria bacterium]
MKNVVANGWQQLKQKTAGYKKDLTDVKTFATDGCTGVPDFIFTHCCDMHDLAYTGLASRLEADNELFRCMKNTLRLQNKNRYWMWCLPYLYWLGVRLFGASRYQGAK